MELSVIFQLNCLFLNFSLFLPPFTFSKLVADVLVMKGGPEGVIYSVVSILESYWSVRLVQSKRWAVIRILPPPPVI